MSADNPKDYKALGRLVRNFDPETWDENKYPIVLKGNIAKFSQNKAIRDFLIGTGNKILAEVSPYDKIWGVFTVFPIPDELSAVSSTAFREKPHNNDETASELITPEVWEIMDKNGKILWNAITDFHAEGYTFLGNFYEAPVFLDGPTYGSNEAAFQA